LLNNDLRTSGKVGEHDRRDGHAPGNRFLGRVVACSGSRATIAAVAEQGGTEDESVDDPKLVHVITSQRITWDASDRNNSP